MSDAGTTRFLSAYIEQREAVQGFLSSFFPTTPESFHNSEHVEVDIRRAEPHIAIPVPNIKAGARKHEASEYTNKKYTPAVIKLETPLSAWSMSQRQPGQDPFKDPVFQRAALNESMRTMRELEAMVGRSVELQCSQVLQSGVITLQDESGNTVYTLDFDARPSLYDPAAAAWAADGSTGNPLGDLEARAILLRRFGKMSPTDVIFGVSAMQRFLANTNVRSRLDNLGLQALAEIAPASRPQGATFYGSVVVGHYRLRLWMYDGYYIDPVTQEPTPYVEDGNVIMLAEGGRRQLTFGSIPMIVPPDARLVQFLPSRISSADGGFDLTTNVWVTPDGQHLNLFVGSRPLALPIALDTHACMSVV